MVQFALEPRCVSLHKHKKSRTQKSRNGAMSDFRALAFVHGPGGFVLYAQARWLCKIVQIHCACAENQWSLKLTKTNSHLTALTKIGQLRVESPLCLCAAPVLPRLPLKHVVDAFWTTPGRFRTPPGRSSDASRAAPNRAVVFSCSVSFSNSL